MTKTEAKTEARKLLLLEMISAFNRAEDSWDRQDTPEAERAVMRDVMSKELARVESLFGYEPYSWARGW